MLRRKGLAPGAAVSVVLLNFMVTESVLDNDQYRGAMDQRRDFLTVIRFSLTNYPSLRMCRQLFLNKIIYFILKKKDAFLV